MITGLNIAPTNNQLSRAERELANKPNRESILKRKLSNEIKDHPKSISYVDDLKSVFQYLQFKERLDILHKELLPWHRAQGRSFQ